MVDLGTKSTDGWSEEQKRLLSVIPHVTGALSILGSAFIIYDVASDRKKWTSPYHRLLFAMGVVDFVSSFATSLSTIPMPAESGDFSYGNDATCALQGFFVHFNIASPLYNLMLSVYFLLTVSFKWSKEDVKKKIEIYLHGVPIAWSFGTAFIVLGQRGFHNSSLWCWINSSPGGCFGNPDVECEYCPYCAIYYRWIFFFGPLWFAALGTIIIMVILVYSVRKTEKRAARWRPQSVIKLNVEPLKNEHSNNSRSMAMDGDDGKERGTKSSLELISASLKTPSRLNLGMTMRKGKSDIEERRERRKAMRMTRVVSGQAFRYCIVFWITWLPGSANRILQLTRGHSYFWVMLLHVIFTPMQGLLNFIVYVDLRVRKWVQTELQLRRKARERRERRREQHRRDNSDVSFPDPLTSSGASSPENNEDWLEISEDDF